MKMLLCKINAIRRKGFAYYFINCKIQINKQNANKIIIGKPGGDPPGRPQLNGNADYGIKTRDETSAF
ncbi:MAG: hypothetical protein ACE5I1_05520 [bacterium]